MNRTALLDTLWDQSAFGLAQASLAGRWLQVNQKLCDITGYTQAELIALNFQQITHPDDRVEHDTVVSALSDDGAKNFSFEKRYLCKNGEVTWVNVSISLVRENGQPAYFVAVVEDIHARKTAEFELRALSARLEQQFQQRTQEFHAVQANAYDAYISIDEKGHIVDWNPQAEATFGWKASEVIGRSLSLTLIPPAYREAHRRGVEHYLRTSQGKVINRRVELPALRRDGSEIDVEIRICPLPSSQGSHRFGAFLHDISERKHAEKELRQSRERFRAIADNIPAVVTYIDNQMIVRFANASHLTLLSIDPATWVGRLLWDLVSGPEIPGMKAATQRVLAGESLTHSFFDTKRQRYWKSQFVPDVRDGVVAGYFSIMTDITAEKQAELEHQRDARIDELTGLPNRRALMQQLPIAIERADRNEQPLALLFIDLNDFKDINDRFGHEAGDELLRQFGRRIAGSVRTDDFVARLAGDEFVVIAESLTAGRQDVQRLIAKINAALADPYLINDISQTLQASIGVTMHERGDSAQSLLAAADAAMYDSKRRKLRVPQKNPNML